MSRPSSRQRRVVILSLAIIVFVMAYYGGSKYKNHHKDAPKISGLSIHPPTPLPPMADTDDQETPIRQSMLLDHWSLLTLDPHQGQDRSPALVRLLQIHNRLAVSPELQQQLQYLYLPRQADEASQEAITALNDNISGLTGEPNQIEETFRRFGVDPDGSEATLYLIGPEAKLHALFTPAEDAATIAQDVTTLINHKQ
ncbi:MAG: hypothetical protein KZQ80_17115 [Candidatus Thiodiazotropha sp. (ex Monitilora ramsayi)]|nr:hypothetical protein [Candidatus Thiodiazotropha sp. (ex Monitilora ramsayi)]